jgi:hypothetical protein
LKPSHTHDSLVADWGFFLKTKKYAMGKA